MSHLYFLEILTMCSTIRLGPKYRHSSKHSVLSPSKKWSLINPLEAKDHLLAKFMPILAVWFGWSWRQRWYSRTIWWHFDDIKAFTLKEACFQYLAVSFEAEEYWFGKVLFCVLRSVLIIHIIQRRMAWHFEDSLNISPVKDLVFNGQSSIDLICKSSILTRYWLLDWG